jgi:DNA-nicking Smr family endonuclease
MAKLTDLKALLEAARANAKAPHPVAPRATPVGTHPTKPPPAAHRPAMASRKSPAAAPRQAVSASKHADGDIDIASAFADVRRLPPLNRARHAPARPAPIPHQRIADDADALAASKYGAEPITDTWEVGQEHEAHQTFLRRGLGADILTKLRRGHWSVQGEIDLHGHTTDEAHDALSDFLVEARQHGYRCVRVIHGKGLTSPQREPVLKGKVRKWLSHWDDVLAYCEAPRHAGGGGAVLVLLRGA